MRRGAVVLAVLVLAAQPASVMAAAANTTPESQTHAYGVSSVWSLTWGGDGPFEVDFNRGDGTGLYWPSMNAVSYNTSYKFYPCVSTNYTQLLANWDSDNGYAHDYTTAREGGGPYC